MMMIMTKTIILDLNVKDQNTVLTSTQIQKVLDRKQVMDSYTVRRKLNQQFLSAKHYNMLCIAVACAAPDLRLAT